MLKLGYRSQNLESRFSSFSLLRKRPWWFGQRPLSFAALCGRESNFIVAAALVVLISLFGQVRSRKPLVELAN
jgi:hypothetical protein